jgi:hypothetical protein
VKGVGSCRPCVTKCFTNFTNFTNQIFIYITKFKESIDNLDSFSKIKSKRKAEKPNVQFVLQNWEKKFAVGPVPSRSKHQEKRDQSSNFNSRMSQNLLPSNYDYQTRFTLSPLRREGTQSCSLLSKIWLSCSSSFSTAESSA